MDARVLRDQYPWWVRFSLIGASSRASQWVWVWVSLIAGLVSLWLALTDSGLFQVVLIVAGIWGLVSAALYYSTIRWMDRNGTWG